MRRKDATGRINGALAGIPIRHWMERDKKWREVLVDR